MCVLIYSTNFETFLILRRIQGDTTINTHRSSCKVSVILVRFGWNLHFLDTFSKSIQIPNLMKIRPAGAELFYVDGGTDGHDDANSRFSQFCKRAWKWQKSNFKADVFNFTGKRPQSLLWNGWHAARLGIKISGVPKRLHLFVIKLYMQTTNVAAGRITQPGGPWVGVPH